MSSSCSLLQQRCGISALENNVSSTMTSLGIYPLVCSLRVFIERIFKLLTLICRLMLCCWDLSLFLFSLPNLCEIAGKNLQYLYQFISIKKWHRDVLNMFFFSSGKIQVTARDSVRQLISLFRTLCITFGRPYAEKKVKKQVTALLAPVVYRVLSAIYWISHLSLDDTIGHFRVHVSPPFQSEAKCEVFVM